MTVTTASPRPDVQRALAKRPSDRWGSALELAAALRAASGLDMAPPDLPKLDEAARDAWLAGRTATARRSGRGARWRAQRPPGA